MQKYFYQLSISLFFILLSFHVQAQNTLGGTLDFTHLGGNNFNIKATIFVDKSVNTTAPGGPGARLSLALRRSMRDEALPAIAPARLVEAAKTACQKFRILSRQQRRH